MNAQIKPPVDLIKHVPSATPETLNELVGRGHAVIRASHELALRPEHRKVGRRFSLAEVEMITGLSRRTLASRLKNPKFPQGEQVGKNRKRLWDLKEVHHIQEVEGIRPRRDKNTDKTIILAVSVFKGGVGKTTMSVNLAEFLAMVGWKVLLLDGDAQGSASGMMGILGDEILEPHETSLGVFSGDTDSLASAIRPTYWDGLDIIPANLQLYGAEFFVAKRLIDEAQRRDSAAVSGAPYQDSVPFYSYLKTALDKVADNYDIIIIDTPPSLGFVTTNALFAADALIVPVHPAPLDFSSTVQFFELLKDVVDQINSDRAIRNVPEKTWDFIGLLPTRYKQDDAYQRQVLNSVRMAFGEFALRNTVVETKVLEGLGPAMKTAYEVESYAGDRRTFQRAIDCLNSTNREIEQLIRSLWPSQRVALEKELGMS